MPLQLIADATAEEEGWTPRPAARVAPGRMASGGQPAPPAAVAAPPAVKVDAASAEEVAAANVELNGLSPEEARDRVRSLQTQASDAARLSVAAGAEARAALQKGELEEATRCAGVAEAHAAEARGNRRLAQAL